MKPRPCVGALALALVWACAAAGAVADNEPQAPPDPNRSLTAAEAEELVTQAVILLDRQRPFDHGRDAALGALVERIHHRAALPALRYVLWNESENENGRVWVMRYMVAIGVPEALDDAIRMLGVKTMLLRYHAWLVLCYQYPEGEAFGFDAMKTPEDNAAAIGRWEEWWKRSKATFKVKPVDLHAPQTLGVPRGGVGTSSD